MATQSIIDPQVPERKGLPARKLWLFIGAGLLIGVILWGALTRETPPPPPSGPDVIAQRARSPESLSETAIGKTDPVDAAARRAEEERKQQTAAGAPAMTPVVGGTAPGGSPSVAVGGPLPRAGVPGGGVVTGPLGGPGAGRQVDPELEREAGAAARERMAGESAVIAVDNSKSQQASSQAQSLAAGRGDDPIARLIERAEADRQAMLARTQAQEREAASVAAALQTAGRAGGASPTRAEADATWQRNVAEEGGQRRNSIQAVAPAGRLMLQRGFSIPAVTTRAINSDIPGVVTARTLVNIYDSVGSTVCLIPAGSVLVGQYNSSFRVGQSRLQFAFEELQLPNGKVFELGAFTGSDELGRAGSPAEVNNRWFQRLGAALLIGVLADRVSPNRGTVGIPGTVVGQTSAAGQILVDTARAELERQRAVQPTASIEAGTRISVEVQRDMVFASAYPGGCR